MECKLNKYSNTVNKHINNISKGDLYPFIKHYTRAWNSKDIIIDDIEMLNCLTIIHGKITDAKLVKVVDDGEGHRITFNKEFNDQMQVILSILRSSSRSLINNTGDKINKLFENSLSINDLISRYNRIYIAFSKIDDDDDNSNNIFIFELYFKYLIEKISDSHLKKIANNIVNNSMKSFNNFMN